MADAVREALALAMEGRYGEALACWPASAPPDPRILSHRARALYEVERDDEAWAASDEAMALGAGVPFVLMARGQLCLDAGRAADALLYFERAREIDGRNVLLPIYAALARVAAGDLERGLPELDAVLVPVSAPLQARVALRLETLLGPGTTSFTRFVLEGDEPPEPVVFAVLNRMLLWPESVASAIHTSLFARGRRSARHALVRAEALMRTGRHAEAAQLLDETAPGAPELALAAAEAHLLAGAPERALALIPASEGTEDPYAAAYRAAALFRLDRATEAAVILARVVPAAAEDYTLPYLWALSLLASGEPRRARQAFEQAFRREGPFVTRELVRAARQPAPAAGRYNTPPPPPAAPPTP